MKRSSKRRPQGRLRREKQARLVRRRGRQAARRRRLLPRPATRRRLFGLDHTRIIVEDIFGPSLHAKRVESLGNGVAGVLRAAVLSVHAIGQAYAELNRTSPKSAINQMQRLLSNEGIELDVLQRRWVEHVIGDHSSVVLVVDWTDFEPDDHTTLCVYLLTTHGRALPLVWRTVEKSTLKTRQAKLEEDMIRRLHEWIPKETAVTLLGDRGFGKQELYKELESLHWDYVLRFKENVLVNHAGESKAGTAWLAKKGKATKYVDCAVTGRKTPVPAIVTVKAAKMKEAWCLATSLADHPASEVVKLYGRRFTIEETFRDSKDLNFGMGLSSTHIKSAARRDRMLMLVAVAHTLLTLLGAACEQTGLDRKLKANTSTKRTHSLYRQGLYWYGCLPTMRDAWFDPLFAAFDQIVNDHPYISWFFAQLGPQSAAAK